MECVSRGGGLEGDSMEEICNLGSRKVAEECFRDRVWVPERVPERNVHEDLMRIRVLFERIDKERGSMEKD